MSSLGTHQWSIVVLAGLAGCASAPVSGPSAAATSGTATLTWQAPTANTNDSPLTDLAGYTIRYGTNPSLLTEAIRISSPTATRYTLSNLPAGVWYFAVSADNSAGIEGPPSALARKKIRAARAP